MTTSNMLTKYAQKSPNTITPKTPNTITPKITEHDNSKNRRTRLLQKSPNTITPKIDEHDFSKNRLLCFLRITKVFPSKNDNDFLHSKFRNIARQATHVCLFCFLWGRPSLRLLPTRAKGLRALRYGWSAAVPWSCLLILHVSGSLCSTLWTMA